MSQDTIFNIHLVLGYVACSLCFSVYFWPRLKSMDSFEAQRVIATIHSFRFFGLVFILPGVVGPNLPASFATFAAYGDFATGALALLALLAIRIRPLFWTLAVALNALESPISSSTTTTRSGSAFLPWLGSWAPHMSSRSSLYPR